VKEVPLLSESIDHQPQEVDIRN